MSEERNDHQTILSNSISIPTTDSEEALRFCQSLSRFLSTEIRHQFLKNFEQESQNTKTQPEISVVIPVYNETDNLPVLYERICTVLKGTSLDYELIFIDDGSTDNSLDLLSMFAKDDDHIIIIELARNFGHQVATSAGLEYSSGKGVVIMDADLQDPPEVLPQFIDKWKEGYDVVYAIREERKENIFKRLAYSSFYRVLKQMANIEIPLDAGDFCIMDRGVVDILKAMPERNRFVRGIRSWVGLRQVGLRYKRQERHAGKSKYTI